MEITTQITDLIESQNITELCWNKNPTSNNAVLIQSELFLSSDNQKQNTQTHNINSLTGSRLCATSRRASIISVQQFILEECYVFLFNNICICTVKRLPVCIEKPVASHNITRVACKNRQKNQSLTKCIHHSYNHFNWSTIDNDKENIICTAACTLFAFALQPFSSTHIIEHLSPMSQHC